MNSPLNYVIKPRGAAWAWTAFRADGCVAGRGVSPSRQVAAACVIRCIARDLQPEAAAKQAA
jgi:hypothetical protein